MSLKTDSALIMYASKEKYPYSTFEDIQKGWVAVCITKSLESVRKRCMHALRESDTLLRTRLPRPWQINIKGLRSSLAWPLRRLRPYRSSSALLGIVDQSSVSPDLAKSCSKLNILAFGKRWLRGSRSHSEWSPLRWFSVRLAMLGTYTKLRYV